MAANESAVVEVRRAWNAWRTADVRACDLRQIHWFQPAGAPRPLVHAYVDCTDIVRGEVPHDCRLGSGPHELLVCVLKRFVAPAVYDALTRLADRRPRPPAARQAALAGR